MSDRPRRPWLRAARAVVLLGAVALVIVVGVGAAVLWPWWVHVRDDAIAITDRHTSYAVAHPGWSFPAHVYSAPAPLDLPKPYLVAEAVARGYTRACPATEPGQYCTDGTVVPRGGHFAEGDQPPGTDGWTRPLALEPVEVAWLVGPDAELRVHLPLDRAPAALIDAILVSEDEDFRSHSGVDFAGMGRALLADLRGGGFHQGASTLTMQVVRGLTGEKERTLERKLIEMARAVAVDGHLGKDGVLQLYLDMPYLGQDGSFSICGFEAASRYYWGVSAADLTLARAATLVAILPAPGRYAPDRDPEAARERRDRLLRRLGERGVDVADALAEPIDASPHHLGPTVPVERYPAYVQATRAALEAALPPATVYGAGLDVFTGLDLVAQERSESLLSERIQYLERSVGRRGDGPLLAAGTVIDPTTGAVVAVADTGMTSSTQFSRATQAKRQAGSSFKPIVYALAFSPGPDGRPKLRPDDTVGNVPRVFDDSGGWRPRNVAGRYSATSTLAYGLTASHNIATATVLERAGGPAALLPFAASLGFDTSTWPAELGLALGQGEVTTLEMARFVATVAQGGHLVAATPVVLARDPAGVTRLAMAPPGDAVLTPDAATLTRELMRLVVEYGTGGAARGAGGFPGYDGELMGKTGTTDDEKDLWFVGSTPRFSAAVWLGYDEPARIGAAASDFASPLFGWWMHALHEGLPRDKFPKVRREVVCTQTGLYPGPGCTTVPTPFLDGDHVRGTCSGTHEAETGITMAMHRSLWELRAAAEAAALAPSEPDPGDGASL